MSLYTFCLVKPVNISWSTLWIVLNQILAAIHGSLLAKAEKATILWAAGVPNSDVAIITEAATNSSEDPGTYTGGITPPSPQTFIGDLAFPSCQITPDFQHPLNLPANCLVACDQDSTYEAEADSGLQEQLKGGAE